MKPPTVFLGEMTSPEVERFLVDHDTVIVPVGSTEQHGPHGPLPPMPSSRPRSPGALPRRSARSSPRRSTTACPIPTPGSRASSTSGSRRSWPSSRTSCAAWRDGLPADRAAQRPLRQHLRAGLRLRERGGPAAGRRARLPDQLLGRHHRRGGGRVLRGDDGLHANRGETSAVLAINPALVDMDAANAEMPPFPEVGNAPAVHTAFFFSSPGSVHRATQSGTWGDAREVDRRVRRALPRRGDAATTAPARRHRADVRGDAAGR